MKPSPSSLLLLLALCGAFLPAHASEKPSLPDRKLPAGLPKFASWEISLDYAASPDQPEEDRSRPVRIVVTRTDDLIREEVFWSDDKKTQKWIYKKLLQVFEENTSGRLFRIPSTTLADDFSDYSQGDFTELAWIGKSNFQGITEVDGRACFLFRSAPGTVMRHQEEELNAGMPAELQGPKGNRNELSAAIDAETLLPVWFDNGTAKKTYRILPAPTSALKMPQEFAAEFDRWLTRIRESVRTPSPP
jgi:hypothetical protein